MGFFSLPFSLFFLFGFGERTFTFFARWDFFHPVFEENVLSVKNCNFAWFPWASAFTRCVRSKIPSFTVRNNYTFPTNCFPSGLLHPNLFFRICDSDASLKKDPPFYPPRDCILIIFLFLPRFFVVYLSLRWLSLTSHR